MRIMAQDQKVILGGGDQSFWNSTSNGWPDLTNTMTLSIEIIKIV